MKNTKNTIIATLFLAILVMAVGYSTFATQLTLNGTAEIVGEWNIKITNIQVQSVNGDVSYETPEFTDTNATFNVTLKKPGDSIVFVITIRNEGTINATLGTVIFKEDSEGDLPAIQYKTSELQNSLDAGEETSFTVTVTYDPKTTEVPAIKTKTITGIIEYVQK